MSPDLRLGFGGSDKRVPAPAPGDGPPPWDLDTALTVVGKDQPRLEAAAKVTGRARYTYDVRLPGMIFARLLRSPHACARVVTLDFERAKAIPGVLVAEAVGGREMRYAGQHFAGVAAESEEILDDACAAVKVEYEVLPHALSVEAARADDAPRVKRDTSNVVPAGRGPSDRDRARVAEAHASADVVVEAEYRTQVQTHACLETHGSVSVWAEDRLTVYASTQATFAFRQTMANALQVPEDRVTVIAEHVGGGFGSKFGADAWDVFGARVAKQTGRPCRIMLDRREEHLVAGNRPDSIQQCKFSAKSDGTLCGAEVRAWGTGGVGGGAGVVNPAIYEFAGATSEQYDVYTHAGSARAFRAPRHPQGIFALEGMLDELAEKLGMDPLALRKKNDRHPVRLAQWDLAAEAIGWGRRQPSGSGKGPVKRGLGCAAARWGHTGRPGTSVLCRVGRDGTVLVANGAQDIGTGTRTILAVLAAEELGLRPADIQVRLGSTADPFGPASGGSTTAPSIGPAARHAAWQAKREILAGVAKALGGDAAAMGLAGGKVTGAPRDLTFAQACALLPTDAVEVLGQAREDAFKLPRFTGEVAGVQFAEVEVDTETGTVRVVKVVAVQDCGLVVDPLLARSQINGGVIQGISYALHEERRLDPTTGMQVNTSFLDYRIAGVREVPEIVSIAFPVANGITSTGMSSLGEPPTVPTAGAIGNAVANALGARIRSLPITPEKVLAALGVA